MNSSQSNTPPSASDPSSSAIQDLSYLDFCNTLGPIETLMLEPESNGNQFPEGEDMQMETSFVESRGRIEKIPNVDCQPNTHSNDPRKEDCMEKMPSLEDCEDNSDKNDVCIEAKGDRTVEALLLEGNITVEALLSEKTASPQEGKLRDSTKVIHTPNRSSENAAGVEYQISGVPKLYKSLQPASSWEFDKCEREDMVELINKVKTTRRKRKKSEQTRENKNEKRCNCKKSGCLKLYCECFSSGVYCGNSCGCKDCINKIEFEDKVKSASRQIQSKNAFAFAPKVTRQSLNFPTRVMQQENWRTSSLHRHKRGCNCKKSMCHKKYCECFQAEVGCTSACCCENCRNTFGTRTENTADADEKTRVGNNFSGAPTSNLSNPNQNGCPESPFSSFSSCISDPLSWKSPQSCVEIANMDCSYAPTSSNNSLLCEMMAHNEIARHGAPSLHLANRNGNGCPEAAPMAPFSSSNIGYLRFATAAFAARLMIPSTNQQLGSMSYVRQLNPRLNLRGSHQFVPQIIPTSASHFMRTNSNDASPQKESDPKNFNGGR